jgi:hypothetical protein
MISTRNLKALPKIDVLIHLCQSIAMLYAIIEPSHGALIKGYAHESPMAEYVIDHGKLWPGVLDQVPEEFKPMLAEPAFSFEETTFCIWRRYSDSSWNIGHIDFPTGDDPDGSQDLLFILDGDPRTYRKWSQEYYEAEYYEREFPLSSIRAIYERKPLTPQIITALNPDITLDDLATDIDEIGYP